MHWHKTTPYVGEMEAPDLAFKAFGLQFRALSVICYRSKPPDTPRGEGNGRYRQNRAG